jgi:succinate dehydrogenase / fumarate reductase membrane anchor subunit
MRDQKLWTWHLAAGVAILVLAGLHMAIMHLDDILGIFTPTGVAPVDWESVLTRAKMPFFMLSYLLLLGAALFHGLYGLRNILFELNPPVPVKTLVSVVLVVAGLALFTLGTWAAIASFALARGA